MVGMKGRRRLSLSYSVEEFFSVSTPAAKIPTSTSELLSPVPALAQKQPPPIVSVVGKRIHMFSSDGMLLTIHGQDQTIKNKIKKSTKLPWLEALAVLGCSKHYVYMFGGNGAIYCPRASTG